MFEPLFIGFMAIPIKFGLPRYCKRISKKQKSANNRDPMIFHMQKLYWKITL